MKLSMERKLEYPEFNLNFSFTDMDQIILSCSGNEDDKYRVSAKIKNGEFMFDEVYEDTLDAIITFRHKLDGFLKGGYREVKEFSIRSAPTPFVFPGNTRGIPQNTYEIYTTDNTKYQENPQYWGNSQGVSGGCAQYYGQDFYGYQNSYTASSNTSTLNCSSQNSSLASLGTP